ncbi:2-oxoadipate dioxygenase/decarboxylase HglS [Mesorhizobium qingshengii]|uniref:2-oxoadipate dioxygenase/decarboxylase HglS n=1 Tax=Mesorhizobium qingshengii TaxID=1165689 RepID=UPI000B80D89F|nr:VOC family protein [Mesorhizobium qingshengii]
MQRNVFATSNDIRSAFSTAMSEMYRLEVPAYGTLMSLVADVNRQALVEGPGFLATLDAAESLDRISQERHGAIRLGTPRELAMARRVFAIMGMFPVGYYDLSEAGIPVHSTAFRPVSDLALAINPFRIFTSLLRLDLIEDEELRQEADRLVSTRDIFSSVVMSLVEKAESQGGLESGDVAIFVSEVLDTFRWHSEASVDRELYRRLHDAHRLIADVVSFKGPHINHLTPRTLDIDAVHGRMVEHGMIPKAVVEGPPRRNCPILLRQTSFKAIEESVSFRDASGKVHHGSHTARFGEIEQRGIALTPKGRALYDRLLTQARLKVRPRTDGSNAQAYREALETSFQAFPDNWDAIRKARLGYFFYSLSGNTAPRGVAQGNIDALIESGVIHCEPIIYQDFLPISAAGIFQSNLGDADTQQFVASPHQKVFEKALGARILNEFDHYAGIEMASLEHCLRLLERKASVA